ncbi:protein charlatan [Maniola jurtina]|uniref:protein charlatan n=1 Tax=Maniola jurtina TaxID=191418 RepID=UPI001E688047|nr:protein charlatan [Maniola jurtina]XP_045774197.1 protein charlatan [Maniola jurtina]XP_045774198.1 protein charlatan [Maniola jurtina]
MEGGAGVASLALDCEDMFKEITKKLYGEEAAAGGVEFPGAEADEELRPEEHITAWGLAALMQNGFPPPGILQANFAPRTDPTAEDRWTAADEPLAWAHSRVAAYNPAQRLFKCADCECVGFLARVAEHWLGTHAQARAFACPLAGCGFASGWARAVRQHLARAHHSDPAQADQLLRDNPALDDLTRYLARLKSKVEARRDAPPAPAPAKRYACAACPYATDRRDLFTRHENIHRDEKPFHCYLCGKQFNRADHVKKHFLRMHRDQPYDLNRIRRAAAARVPQAAAPPAPVVAPAAAPPAAPRVKPEPPAPKPASPVRRKGERRYACCYCAWSGVDNWCLKRHLNTHLKPFACALCEYKAARAERLATHVHKVHNKKACAKCPFLADDQPALAAHLRDAHHIESRNLKVPSGAARGSVAPAATVPAPAAAAPAPQPAGAARRREGRAAGAARLFGYLEASDGSGDEFEAPLGEAFAPHYARDKENAAPPLPHALHDHCLRY